MIAFLETERAREEARKMANAMRTSLSYAFPSDDKHPLSDIKKDTLFAVMIARTKNGTEKILRSFSGFINGEMSAPGYVNPCFSQNEYKAIKKESDEVIDALTERIKNGEKLEEERYRLSLEYLSRLNALYSFSTWDGKTIPMPDKAPTGTGDCAGLRLINTALRNGYEIIGLAEFSINEEELKFRAPCKERCERLLPSMLGLDFLYADEDLAVINKPDGMLSVPGRGDDKLDSAAYRFHKLFPSSPAVAHTHRLDMDTSGLLIMAFSKEAHRTLSMEFESGEVEKEYEAVLEGVIKEDEGIISAPIRLDVDNRPYQIVDFEQGKHAVTYWKRLSVEIIDGEKCTRVRFFPKTGRTHQLRVHSKYIGHPIKGDRLYGTRKEGERLMLHAASISFIHPRTKERVVFTSDCPF